MHGSQEMQRYEEDTYVYGPLGDIWTDAADESADGNECVLRKTDADMEPMRVVVQWDVGLVKVLRCYGIG